MGMIEHPNTGIWVWKEDIQSKVVNVHLSPIVNMETEEQQLRSAEDVVSNENFLHFHQNNVIDESLLNYVNSQFDQLNGRLDGIDVHLAGIDTRIDQIEQRIADNHQSIMQYLSDSFASLHGRSAC
ncbi:hypothetical protein RIF29_33775 [Crotalaria pallida]|uniref:Uncharacterized protein n=1 Tax=Crotalaria pallida TaxID=3830 RepID=A0AAN9EB01_CROPI